MPKSSASRSIARRVTLLSVGMMGVVLALVALTVSVLTARETRQQIQDTVVGNLDSVVQSVDSFEETSRDAVIRAYRTFRLSFEPNLRLIEERGELENFGIKLNGDTSYVDQFSRETGGGVATIFVRKGDDFLRIASSIKNEKGERVLGTSLRQTSPKAHAQLLAGKTYTGLAALFGKEYMTQYEPIKDESGKLIGAFFVGLDVTAFHQTVIKQLQEVRFFQHGGIYTIDPGLKTEDAVFASHPSAAGKKVLEVYPQAGAFLAQLSQAKDSVVVDAMPLRGVELDQPWAVLRPTRSGAWVVAEVSDSEAMAGHRKLIALIWLVFALAVTGLGAGLFWLLRSGVSQPLQELAQAITLVAQGDLTKVFRSTRKDEMGVLVHEVEGMRERYMQMLLQVRHAVDSITTASAEIASGNQDLSYRTEQTASSLQETAQSVEHLTATVQQSADAAEHANGLARSAAEVAARGGQVVGEVVTTMEDINQSSRKIADIIGVIDGIAFQTNILALNAAVEAARAGEQGRGFAVVASEVRNLAGRSAQAAHEIKDLISASVNKVESGTRLVQNAGSTMQEIVSSVQRVGEIINEITAAAAEQSTGINQVNSAVGALDQMTQQNAALVEESAAAAISLREQAQRLDVAVQVFRLNDEYGALPSSARLQIQ